MGVMPRRKRGRHRIYDKSALLASQEGGAGANRQFEMEGMLACDLAVGREAIRTEHAPVLFLCNKLEESE
jgi:hypothetical protein